MDNFEDEIRQLIEPICMEDSFILYDVAIQGTGKNRIIKIIADTETGVTLDQCHMLSRKISDLFYRKDLFNGDYCLEVSSPGTSKPLQEPYEYKRSIGKNLKVNYREGEEQKSTIGKLVAFDDDIITLQVEKEEVVISLNNIEKAKIRLKW